MFVTVFVILILIMLFLLGPRFKLDASSGKSDVPRVTDEEFSKLADWINVFEKNQAGVIDGTQAHIQWANADKPQKTRLAFMYVHGFTATWKETAPVTEMLAEKYQANVFQTRISGHGLDTHGMKSSARDWLQSMQEAWDIASQIGEKVVIVATSTGVPLSVWLQNLPHAADRIHAFIFLSPNFRITKPFAFLLTWPWAKYWIRFVTPATVSWQPENEGEATYWTSEYPINAVMEMQSVLDWLQSQDLGQQKVPLAMMYMKNDPTICVRTAKKAFEAWGCPQKLLIPVEIDGEASQHVFVGDIKAPHRTDWVVDRFDEFLQGLAAKN